MLLKKEILKVMIAALALSGGGWQPADAQEDIYNIIWKQDYEETPLGLYSEEDWKRDWNYPRWYNGLDKTYIIDVYGDRAMKFNFPMGCVGASAGGGQWWAPLGPGHEEVYFSYNMMFRPGFDWVMGGKLPGLGGGDNPTGGKEITWDGGFTARIMFQGRHEWDTNYPWGKCFLYCYHQDKTQTYGDSYTFGEVYFPAEDSLWYNMTIRLVLNTVGASGGANNGLIEFFLNGKHIFTKTGMRWRNLNTIWIDTQHIVSFFGGGTPEYGAHRDEWILFDDFYAFTYKEGVDVARGRNATTPGTMLQLPNIKADPIPKPPESEFSDTTAPSIPTLLQPTFLAGSYAGITWEASTDDVSVSGYRIFVNGDEYGTVKKNESIIGGLEPRTDYLVNVSAYDGSLNESTQSETLVITTVDPDFEAPSIPINLRGVDSTHNSITIQWSPSFDNIAISGYEVYVNEEIVGTTINTSYSVIGLDPSTAYSIAVAAFDHSNNISDPSEPVTLRTRAPDLEPPSIPDGLATTLVTQNSIGLVWNSSTDNVKVAGYHIDVNGIRKGQSITNSYTVAGLLPGIEYAVAVSTFDESFNESGQAEITTKTKNPDISSTPSLPSVGIEDLDSYANISRTVSMISSYGYTELLDYGIAISEDIELQTSPRIFYADKGSSEIEPVDRVTRGLQVLYDFSEEEGGLIHNRAENGVPADLTIQTSLQTKWLPGRGLKVIGNSIIATKDVPAALLDSLSRTSEITLEAWIRPELIDQSGPARLISISLDNFNRAAHLGHEGNSAYYNYVARLTTTNTGNENGFPEVATTADYISLNLHHVVYTRNSSGVEQIFVNGIEKYSGTRGGDLSFSGKEFYLSLANELSGERPWLGTFYLAAVYNRAFSKEDVGKNFSAGLGEITFTTNFELEPNIPYYLTPFVRTDQGIVYGDVEELTLENVMFSSEQDSLYMSIYPNPSDGNFRVRIQCALKDTEPAFLRIADFSGNIIYNEILELTGLCGEINYPELFSEESYYINENGIVEFDFLLSPLLNEGIYSVMLIVGNKSTSKRLIVM